MNRPSTPGATTTVTLPRQRNAAAKFVAIFALGAASCGGLVYSLTSGGKAATVNSAAGQAQNLAQPAERPLPTIVVQIVQPPPPSVASNVTAPLALVSPPVGGLAPVPSPGNADLFGPRLPPDYGNETNIAGVPVPTPGSIVTTVSPVVTYHPTSPDPLIDEAVTASNKKRPPAPVAPPLPQPITVNINTATQAQLESLPSVGPATAIRIIEYRTKHGPFKRVEDLDKVKGIGEKTIAKLAPLVTVQDLR